MSAKLPPTAILASHDTEESSAPVDFPRLAKWMRAVISEHDAVLKHFKPNDVHDLRVALRRCRSVAQGLAELDPSSAWVRLRKEAKKPLAALGILRDAEVMRDWIVHLHVKDKMSTDRLRAMLDTQDREAI